MHGNLIWINVALLKKGAYSLCLVYSAVVTVGNRHFAECFYVCRVHSLRHSANKLFAKCCKKNTRQTRQKTLGKLEKKHSTKLGTRQINMFAECNYLALGKEICLPSVIIWHTTKNSFFSLLTLKLFLLSTYNMWYSC